MNKKVLKKKNSSGKLLPLLFNYWILEWMADKSWEMSGLTLILAELCGNEPC